MTSITQYCCQGCRGLFTARKADRKRGWARYCSKSCKAIKQEQRTGQYSKHKELIESNHYDHADEFAGGWDEHKDWL
jgi:hypothetical protein